MFIPRLANAKKPLLAAIALVVLIQTYYTLRFAQLSYYVDNGKAVPHPIAFEAFPFVVYNMYSGKIDDWNKYSYLMIEANGEQVKVTDLPVILEDQLVNPSGKFLELKQHDFEEQYLLLYLQHLFRGRHIADDIYYKASNKELSGKEDEFGRWLQRYLSLQLGKQVTTLKLYNCTYEYTAAGTVQLLNKGLVYQL